MLDGRKRITSVIAACGVATLSGSLLVAAPSVAEPDIDDVEARVDKLYHEAEIASERYNDARVDLKKTQARLKSLRADLDRQEERVEAVRGRVASTIVSQYQGQALSTTSQVFLSQDPDKFLDQLATVTAYNDQQGQLMAELATQIKQFELRETAAERELARLAKTKETLAEHKAEIDEKASEAESLLGDLEARAAQASRSASREPLPNVAVSGRAGAAVNYGLAQVGDAYVYGAAGPDAWDCSGLTMMAWRQAGVSLPHSSSGQMSAGPSVSSSDLQPGDLVFYYSPVSHVGMYIGDGKIVHAANPESGVEVVGVFSMPYSGAVRPG
ncbi:MAG TPA: NlpC/P60 family protein [Nocardioidaceae bacterium]|nr:NlpC/P60 family protein [Nocardioidaceae bacterium]